MSFLTNCCVTTFQSLRFVKLVFLGYLFSQLIDYTSLCDAPNDLSIIFNINSNQLCSCTQSLTSVTWYTGPVLVPVHAYPYKWFSTHTHDFVPCWTPVPIVSYAYPYHIISYHIKLYSNIIYMKTKA